MSVMVGIGEVLWDVFADRQILGGAPANFAYHASQLGHQAFIVSRVGNDRLGRRLLSALRGDRLATDYIQSDPRHPTGTVRVDVAADGTPDFTITPDVAWDYLEPSDSLIGLAERTDAVCFGSLAQRNRRSRQTIEQFLDAAAGALKVFDINLRQHYWSAEIIKAGLDRADLLKLNDDEQAKLAELLPGPDGPVDWARSVIDRYHLRLVCVTRGSRGCLLVSPDQHAEHPGFEVDVVDTVGSGDAFTAALVSGYLAGQPLPDLAKFANRIGAYVATQPGATPAHPPLPNGHAR